MISAKKTVVLAMVLLACAAPAFGQTRVSGIIERETRWRESDGPFILEGDILIARRATLIIMPGTRVIISSGARKIIMAEPLDRIDSTLVSIRVQGSLNAVGTRNNPIVFEPERSEYASYQWRGIIFDHADLTHTELAFTEISGAVTGITIRNTNVTVRNNAIENCNIGIHAMQGGAPRIINNLISSCFTAGIKVERSNPEILNNIIAFNNNLGLWCDNSSKITFKYNCVFGNTDGNFLNCEPEFGKITRGRKGGDSTDNYNNIVSDPVFRDSPAETRAKELDVSLPSDTAKVLNPRLLSILNFQFGTPPKIDSTLIGGDRRQLSKYSPCINAGDPGGAFKNVDGTKNTMGPMGGPN